MTARGLRNNNPLNIRWNVANKWVGQLEPDGGFCVFDSPISGIRAGAVLIQAHYDRRYAINIEKLIEIWAPPNENDTGAYAATVAKLSGFGVADVLDFHSYEHIKPVLMAMIRVECGSQPYSDAQIDAGLARAGIVPAIKPSIQASRTITGAKVATASTVGGLGLETARQVADSVTDFAPVISMALRFGPWIIGGIALAAIGYIVYARWDDRRRGLR